MIHVKMLTIAGEFFVEGIKVLIVLPCRGGERAVKVGEKGGEGVKRLTSSSGEENARVSKWSERIRETKRL